MQELRPRARKGSRPAPVDAQWGDYGPEVKETTGLGLQSLRDAESGGPSMLLKQNPGAELVRQGDWP